MRPKPMVDRPELTRVIADARRRFDAMSRDEQEAILRQQRDGYVRAEMSWPAECEYR